MQLSWFLRVVCVALCSAGLLQAMLEWTAWAAAPALLRKSGSRRAERSLFWLAFSARLGPWLLVFSLLLPAYVRGEDNPSVEHVSLACIAFAACVLLWSLAGILRVSIAARDVRSCCRHCRPVQCAPGPLPMLLHPGEQALMAVAGLFVSRVIVSRPLLDTARFSPDAFAVALAHETSHARHRDNLKALLLSLLPHVPASTQKRPSLRQQWRLAAELAADEDSAQGESGRALLLAQVLVAVARESNSALPKGAVALVAGPEHLRLRVERLLAPPGFTPSGEPCSGSAGRRLACVLPLAASAALLGALGCTCILFGHEIAEFLLHMG